MRNAPPEEEALLIIERNPLLLLVSFLLSAVLILVSVALLKRVNPWGLMTMIPAGLCAFQTLWLFLHPFALIFKDKIEIKQSFLHQKTRYFVDLKKIVQNSRGHFTIVYNDNEIEPLQLFGIRPAQIPLLRTMLENLISESLSTRPQD